MNIRKIFGTVSNPKNQAKFVLGILLSVSIVACEKPEEELTPSDSIEKPSDSTGIIITPPIDGTDITAPIDGGGIGTTPPVVTPPVETTPVTPPVTAPVTPPTTAPVAPVTPPVTSPIAPVAPVAPPVTEPVAPPSSSYNYLVSTAAQLKDALNKATSGQVVYIDDNAKINMTGLGILKLKGGVTLKSGRGSVVGGKTSLGGMLYTTDRKHIMIDITGEKARITGVRLSGPDITTRMEETKAALAAGTFQSLPFSYGVRSNYSGLQIDNSELMGWTKAAISISSSTAHIHHNYIHHNQHYSLGYGVVVNGSANALIENNSFHLNRHSIAGSGSAGQTYEARFNTFYKNGYTSLPHIDMHSPGGKLMNIHDNTFYHKGALAIYLLGTPTEHAYISNNKFASTSQNYTIKTSSKSTISGNSYGIAELSVDNNVSLKTF